MIQNILWRIRNGELGGVRPRVIVILAGTNNVGSHPGESGKVSEISEGLRTLVDACREEAPGAKIILMGILPRNNQGSERLAVMPEIVAINKNLSKFTDEKEIFFVDISSKLADPDGLLFPGMTDDGLHLSEKGYQIWANALMPLLEKLLGPRATNEKTPSGSK